MVKKEQLEDQIEEDKWQHCPGLHRGQWSPKDKAKAASQEELAQGTTGKRPRTQDLSPPGLVSQSILCCTNES